MLDASRVDVSYYSRRAFQDFARHAGARGTAVRLAVKQLTVLRRGMGYTRKNPAAARTLTVQEVRNVLLSLAVPKALTARFLRGLAVEWAEHGGGRLSPEGVGELVLDHLHEDLHYYQKSA